MKLNRKTEVEVGVVVYVVRGSQKILKGYENIKDGL